MPTPDRRTTPPDAAPENFTSAEQPRPRDQRRDNAALETTPDKPPPPHEDGDAGGQDTISVGTPPGGA